MEPTGIDRVISSSFNLKYKEGVLLFISRTLLFLSFCAVQPACNAETSPTALAVDLFEEGSFSSCALECSRILISDPTNETALLLRSVSELNTGKDCKSALKAIIDSHQYSGETCNMARFELARAYWKSENTSEAMEQFKRVFLGVNKGSLFLRAGCSLSILLDEHPDLAMDADGIRNQLKASSSLWTRKIYDECRIPTERKTGAITGKPAQWVISFYRNQISPALGRRCSLTPSCSEYGMQSLRKHGLLGVAMIADRTIREPDVVAEKPSPVRIGNRWFYSDPVDAHDWWMTPEK